MLMIEQLEVKSKIQIIRAKHFVNLKFGLYTEAGKSWLIFKKQLRKNVITTFKDTQIKVAPSGNETLTSSCWINVL